MDIESCSSPFRHWLIRGAIPEGTWRSAAQSIPSADWDGWVRYENDLERKRTTRGGHQALPTPARDLFAGLTGFGFVAFLGHLTGIPDLTPDPLLWGGGLHIADPGDHLAPHLDFAVHPKSPGHIRRLNLVLFLCDVWEEEWGGEFQLCDSSGAVVKAILPEPGLAIIWEASDAAYHATAKVTGPRERPTAACYYLTPLPAATTRTRAMFLPTR